MITEGNGEEYLAEVTVTTDRGFGKEGIMNVLPSFGVRGKLVPPENVLICHLFVGKSYLLIGRDDEWNEYSSKIETEQPGCTNIKTVNESEY